MVDRQLEVRRGFNTGAEPGGYAFIDKALSERVVMSGNAEHTLLEGISENVRMLGGTEQNEFPAFHSDVAPVGVRVRLYNTFGEVISSDESLPVSAVVQPLPLSAIATFAFALAAGERITVQRYLNQVETGTGPVQIYPAAWDAKHKPKPAGGGGLSDGNVVVLRERLSSSAIDVGPSAGKAWRPLSIPSYIPVGTPAIGHFGAAVDVPALVDEFIVNEDATAVALGQQNAPAQAVTFSSPEGAWFSGGWVLAHPYKLRYRLAAPVPAGRVLLMAAFIEFDLPRD